MLLDYNMSADNRIYIDTDFPIRRLVEVFNPILKFYIISKYSLDSFNKWSNQKKMVKALVEFAIDNPRFGRKIITRHVGQIYKLSKLKSRNKVSMGLTTIPPLEMINVEKGHFFIDKVKSERILYSIFPHSNNNNNEIIDNYPYPETQNVYIPGVEAGVEADDEEIDEEVDEVSVSSGEGEILEEHSEQNEPLIQPQSPGTSSIEADIQIEDYERAPDSISSNEGTELVSINNQTIHSNANQDSDYNDFTENLDLDIENALNNTDSSSFDDTELPHYNSSEVGGDSGSDTDSSFNL